MADLQTQLVFPPEIAVTRLRPDIVMWSRSTRNLIIIKLTVPWEKKWKKLMKERERIIKTWWMSVKKKDGRLGVGQ